MQILRVRVGFATNSSSTHSVIMAPFTGGRESVSDFEYGWEYFLLKDKESKRKYCGTMLYFLSGGHSEKEAEREEAAERVKKLFGEDSFGKDGYIDHQSMLTPPKTHEGKESMEFMEEYLKFLVENENVGIQGGNDNSDYYYMGQQGDLTTIHRMLRYGSDCIVRKDEPSGVWTVFSRNRYGDEPGVKLHVKF